MRGAFGSIATSIPGLQVCEHMPQAARVMDRLAVLRSMHHPMTNHNAAAFTAFAAETRSRAILSCSATIATTLLAMGRS